MFRLPSRIWLWSALAGLAWCVPLQPAGAQSAVANPSAFLDQAERLCTEDHARFVRMLEQIHHEAPAMSPAEQWRLRYLDAWETMYQGGYAKSESELRELIDRSGDPVLVAKASGLLLSNLAINRRYEEAFALANRITTELPRLKSPDGRFLLLINLSQMMVLAGQPDLAVRYAQMAEDALPAGQSRCRSIKTQLAALQEGKRLASDDARLRSGIESCNAAHQPIYANALWLIQVSLLLNEGRPHQALAVLDRIASGIRAGQYQPQTLSAQVQRAQAFEKLGNDHEAGKAARAALALSAPGDINPWLKEAYEILYRIEKKRGNTAAALTYYEQYTIQDKGDLDDISARSLAYQTVQQQVLSKRLETETLSKQNSILRLQQALTTKAMEASRLYITLLLVVLGSIVLWLFRLKRSQLRFKRLSCLDGLTATANHQHFIGEAERILRLLEKRHAGACLILIDLDHFKQVNDNHGHAVGDAVLRRTAAACQAQLRPGDLLGRLGGEEFGVLLPDCTRAQGMEIAGRIRIAIQDTPEAGVVAISASVGVAATDTCGYRLQRLCSEADAALYRAKRAGRNRVVADIETSEPVSPDAADQHLLPASLPYGLDASSEAAAS